jgi:hypothetical protein
MESFGVAKTDIKKLKEGGYHTIEAVSPLPRSALCMYLAMHIFNLLSSPNVSIDCTLDSS